MTLGSVSGSLFLSALHFVLDNLINSYEFTYHGESPKAIFSSPSITFKIHTHIPKTLDVYTFLHLTSIHRKKGHTMGSEILCACLCVSCIILLLCSPSHVLPHTFSWSNFSDSAISTENRMTLKKFAYPCVLLLFIQNPKVNYKWFL